jgi:hypothetical protein
MRAFFFKCYQVLLLSDVHWEAINESGLCPRHVLLPPKIIFA